MAILGGESDFITFCDQKDIMDYMNLFFFCFFVFLFLFFWYFLSISEYSLARRSEVQISTLMVVSGETVRRLVHLSDSYVN